MATSYTLRIDHAAANAVAGAFALQLITDTTRRVLNRATVLTPVDTGRLRAANQMRVQVTGTQVTGTVFNDTEYADMVHDGTRAHVVRPRRKRVLRFTVGGRVVYSAYARIPAHLGRPWLYDALVQVAAGEGFHIIPL